MKLQILKGSTDVSIDIFIQNSASTTGSGLTGLAYNTASLTCYYHRMGASAAQLTLATQTVNGAHTDGGFVEIDATNMPGFYRLDLSDAIVASGVNAVTLMLKGAANMAPLPIEIELVAYNPQSATDLGLSNLDTTVSSRLASASYTAPPTANENADALLDRTNGIETGYTPREVFRLIASTHLGKVSGAGTGTEVFRSITDTKDRVTSTVDAEGNRTAVVLDGT